MDKKQRIYLDNAATSWPKPEPVYDAVDRFQREIGVSVGRTAAGEGVETARAVLDTRRLIAELIGAESAQRIVLTAGCTDSLNMAIHGTLRQGDHVVTTVVEHNSVLRPLRHIEDAGAKDAGAEDAGTIAVTRVGCDRCGVVDAGAIADAIRPNTRLIALIHASNVTGAIQPVRQVGRIARDRGILFLVDAAQSLGHIPLDVGDLQADMLAAPGHKGLLGPAGIGILYVRPGVERQLDSMRQGGTGTQSEDDRQPDELPEKYEAGTHNIAGIFGLRAGVSFVRERGVDAIRRHDRQLTARLLEGFGQIEGVTIHGPADPDRQAGIVAVTVAGFDPREVGALLDSAYAIQVRTGFQCAPLMHRALGTAEGGGTVRFSVGPFNTPEQIETTVAAVAELAASADEYL